ncbi:MAG: hypothetical protein H7836_11775 [Magnetococcus sp. YQC-3]
MTKTGNAMLRRHVQDALAVGCPLGAGGGEGRQDPEPNPVDALVLWGGGEDAG